MFGEFGLDGLEALRSPPVSHFPGDVGADLLEAATSVPLAAGDFARGVGDVVLEAVDPLGEGGLLVAASWAESREASDLAQFAPAPVLLSPTNRFGTK